MQDEIVTRLAYAMHYQLPYAEAARLKRTPAANPDAEDLALQCQAIVRKGGLISKEADAGYRLCEQAIAVDPNNVLALARLSEKLYVPVVIGRSTNPEADLKRSDELASQAVAFDPNSSFAHAIKAMVVLAQGRVEESITEGERALELDPSNVGAVGDLGFSLVHGGQFEKGLEYLDRTLRLSPRDPALAFWYGGKSWAYFGLKQYDEAIDWARRSIAINPNGLPFVHGQLIAALALTGRDAEAREALQHYVALPGNGPRTMPAWRAFYRARGITERNGPRILECDERIFGGLRKAGMPEG
jgi:tetratricopeptide (TPR) repeat protein